MHVLTTPLSLLTLLCSTLLLPYCSAGQTNPHAVILMYHRFGETTHPSTNITIEQFDAQLQYIKDNDFSVLPLEEVVQALKNRSPLPDKSVAITIDDAYKSIYTVAYPRLKKFGFPFTVFVATGGVDDNLSAYMDWRQIRELKKDGVLFANHTAGHEYLVRRKDGESLPEWETRITSTIRTAQGRLTDILGEAPLLFAYPYGEYNAKVMEIADNLGYTAFGQHSGAAGVHSNSLALPRFPMAEAFADMDSFKIKVSSLPLPVTRQEPMDPQTREKRPQLKLTLAPTMANLTQLACYAGNTKMNIKWLKSNEEFIIQADKDLPTGRSRYNCTAPNPEGDRYYWFSHQWISP